MCETFVPIGFDCFSDAVSTSFIYGNASYYCLRYTFPDFIFGFDEFQNYCFDRPVEECFLPSNRLVLVCDPGVEILQDFFLHKYEQMDALLCEKRVQKLSVNTNNLQFVLKSHLQLAEGFILELDPYYLREVYQDLGGIPAYIHDSHCVFIHSVSNDAGECHITDSQLKVNGKVQTDTLAAAIKDMRTALFYFEKGNNLAVPDVFRFLKESFENHSKSRFQTASGGAYVSRLKAVQDFSNTFFSLVDCFERNYGEWAPQLILYPLKPFIHQLKGASALFDLLAENTGDKELGKISCQTRSCAKGWSSLNMILSGIAVRRMSIHTKKERVERVLDNILEQHRTLYHLIDYYSTEDNFVGDIYNEI